MQIHEITQTNPNLIKIKFSYNIDYQYKYNKIKNYQKLIKLLWEQGVPGSNPGTPTQSQ